MSYSFSNGEVSHSHPTVKVRVDGPAGTIILQRPECRNAINRDMIADLSEALQKLHGNRSVRAVVLTGAGAAFCAGMDLKEMQAAMHGSDPQSQWFADAQAYAQLIQQLWLYPKPIIAAVNGPAVAGGLGLVMASDLVLACPEASFGVPEPRRGIVAGMVAPFLAFRVGGARAAQMLLTGNPVSAARAEVWGLVAEIVPHANLWVRGVELANEIARSSPDALMLTKRLLNETIGEHFMTFMSSGTATSAASRTTDAAQEGLKAFLEKRDPKWW